MPTPSPYLTAMRMARARGHAIDVRSARQIARAMREWADDLARILHSLPGDRQLAARASVEEIRRAARDLERRIIDATRQGQELTFRDTLDVWQTASKRVARRFDVPDAMMGAVARPEATTAQAFASMDSSREWRSLVRGHVVNAATEASDIVQGALLRGESPEVIARALRPYVLGRDRTPEPLAPELAKQGAATRASAYTMEHNARRIAFSESHNARREAEVRHFQADPLIAVGQWTLSPNRGTQRLPDACDALALLDWYGLGVGVFPLTAVPLSPHPWDRCEVLPIVRQTKDAHRPKPTALRLVLDPMRVPLPGEGLLTPAAVVRIRLTLSRILVLAPRAA